MSYRYRFIVNVDVERSEGKFATRDELADQLREAIEGADPGDLEGENEGRYTVASWEVEEVSVPKTKRARKPLTQTTEEQ